MDQQITLSAQLLQPGDSLTVTLPAGYSCRVTCNLGGEALEDVTADGSCSFVFTAGWLPALSHWDTTALEDRDAPYVTVEVYEGATCLSRYDRRFDIRLPQSYAPECRIVEFYADNSLSDCIHESVSRHLFQGVSRLGLGIGTQASYGAAVSKISTAIDGKTYDGSQILTQVFTGFGDLPLVITVTDSRGMSATLKETVFVGPYRRPRVVLGAQGCFRCDGEGNPDAGGTAVFFHGSADAHPLGGSNPSALRCRLVGGGETTPWLQCPNQGVIQNLTALPTEAYALQVQATDLVCQGSILELPIPRQEVYAHQGRNALALGMYREQGGLEVAWPAHFYGGISLGDTTLTETQLQQLLSLL